MKKIFLFLLAFAFLASFTSAGQLDVYSCELNQSCMVGTSVSWSNSSKVVAYCCEATVYYPNLTQFSLQNLSYTDWGFHYFDFYDLSQELEANATGYYPISFECNCSGSYYLRDADIVVQNTTLVIRDISQQTNPVPLMLVGVLIFTILTCGFFAFKLEVPLSWFFGCMSVIFTAILVMIPVLIEPEGALSPIFLMIYWGIMTIAPWALLVGIVLVFWKVLDLIRDALKKKKGVY